jgi:hypothetical protein
MSGKARTSALNVWWKGLDCLHAVRDVVLCLGLAREHRAQALGRR